MTKLFSIVNRESGNIQKNPKKTRTMLVIIAAIVLVGTGVLLAVSYYLNNRLFNSFEVLTETDRKDSNNVTYQYFYGDVVKYSRNGVSAMTPDGKVLWNGGYEMKQPHLDICENYAVVSDVEGRQFYVYNGEDEGRKIETSLPIMSAKAAGQGIIAVLLQDKNSDVLNIYNPYSSTDPLLVEIPTNVSEEGYPLDYDISPDGNSLAASYMVLDGTNIENRVSFYNFTSVGRDKNTLVGGKSFGKNVISHIEYMDSDEVAVFYENGFSLFSQMKNPELIKDVTFTEDIRSAACSQKYIAIVAGNENSGERLVLHLYNRSGVEVMHREITCEYSKMDMYEDEIVFSSSHHCYILRLNGHEKLDCAFDFDTEGIFPTDSANIYILITDSKLKRIELTTKG